MSGLVTELTSRNVFVCDEAYERACRYVEDQRSVSVVDIRDNNSTTAVPVDISIFAAKQLDMLRAPSISALKELAARQAVNIALSLGIVTVGRVADLENQILAAMGPSPVGASRWVEAVDDPDELYELIVRWLINVLDRKTRSGYARPSVAEDTADTIERTVSAAGEAAVSQSIRFRPVP